MLDGFLVFLAQYLPYFIALAALGWVFSFTTARQRWFVFMEICLILILSRGLIAGSMHFFYEHPRPPAVLGIEALLDESGNSFPSGHASFLFALAGGMLMYSWRWGMIYLILALINGIARIICGVHWPLDILGGIAVGIFSAAFVHFLLGKYFPKIKVHEGEPLG